MPPDSTSVSTIFSNPAQLIPLIAAILTGLGALVGIVVAFINTILPSWRRSRERHSLKKRFGKELNFIDAIENSTRYYVEPLCQSLDPAGAEELRLTYGAKQNLFTAIDDLLNNPTEHRYLFLLADSGMGKTSFLLNYYARHIRKRKRKFELALVPLGIPDADKRIKQVNNKNDTVLFLDALDEDTLAIVDHGERLKNLLAISRDFYKILITCRTQFFPKDEEIPQETGIIKIGARGAGEQGQYLFHKLYLTPFTNEQIDTYLKKRYPFGQRKRRRQARVLVDKIEHLSARPMLLSYINELLKKKLDTTYSFQLYEEIVQAWLKREEGIVEGIKAEPLRQFSERLAVDLYTRRKDRGAERILKAELAVLAHEWNIPLDDWQLSGRSLLNRDAVGNYKFAHRSIMEYLFVKRFTELDTSCGDVTWTDQMKSFLTEIFKHKKEKNEVIKFDLKNADFRGLLRAEPMINLQDTEVNSMIILFGFFDGYKNKNGKGISHNYKLIEIHGKKLVKDDSTSLTWEQSGSEESKNYKEAQNHIGKLNHNKYDGFSNWRLPTLEEAMSLMEPQKKNEDLYIDPIFAPQQRWIWTADKSSPSDAWVALFNFGYCDFYLVDSNRYVRAVR